MRLAAALAVVAVALIGQQPGTGSAAPNGGQIVLGSKHRAITPGGYGWGTAHPRAFYNGNDPSGAVWNIRWDGWGGKDAIGRGLTWIFRPQGAYYSKPGAIELRVFGIGRCTATGPRAYLHLQVRVASRPGGPLGKWFAWGGDPTTCHH